MKNYKVIISDWDAAYLEYIPAKDKAEIKKVWGGNGTIEKIEELDYQIDLTRLYEELTRAGYGKMEIDLITRCLRNTNVGTW